MLPDALSRMYEFDGLRSEQIISAPVYVGLEALAMTLRQRTNVQSGGEDTVTSHVSNAPPLSLSGVHHQTTSSVKKSEAGSSASHAPTPSDTPKRTRRQRKPSPPPAETGRPETSAEFARRVKDRFVLLGPGERKIGRAHV